jgi:hypothetical protein
MHSADLRAGTRPMYLVGSAEVPFPAIGFLEEMGLEGSAIGFSLAGRLPYETSNDLYDGPPKRNSPVPGRRATTPAAPCKPASANC